MKKQLLILIALCISVIGYSQTFTDSFITYNVTSTSMNTVEVTDYNTAGGTAVTIPETVINNSITYSVASIGDFAFVNDQLTSVSIGNNIVSIGLLAFNNNQLSSVTIPASVTTLGNQAFSYNQFTCIISEATTPSAITTGGNNDTFGPDRSNIDLSIPSGTASAYATAQWTGFDSVAEGLTGIFIVDNITYQIDATPNNEVTVTSYNIAGGTVVNIPTNVSSACTLFNVTSIGQDAFENKGLTSVIIPNSVTDIGHDAFNINNLSNVTIPSSVNIIQAGAFANNQLADLIIPNNVTSIGISAFVNNQITGSLTIPNSVTDIGSSAFNNSLANVILGNNLTSIGLAAFNNNNLNSITIPASVTSIGPAAFKNNPLANVYSESLTPPAINTGIDDSFSDDRSSIHLHIPGGTMATYVTDAGALWTGFNPVSEDALSVSDFELEYKIKVITTANDIKVISNGSVRLENYIIYSISGSKIKEGTESIIAIDAISKGIYILKLDFDQGTISKKLWLDS